MTKKRTNSRSTVPLGQAPGQRAAEDFIAGRMSLTQLHEWAGRQITTSRSSRDSSTIIAKLIAALGNHYLGRMEEVANAYMADPASGAALFEAFVGECNEESIRLQGNAYQA